MDTLLDKSGLPVSRLGFVHVADKVQDDGIAVYVAK